MVLLFCLIYNYIGSKSNAAAKILCHCAMCHMQINCIIAILEQQKGGGCNTLYKYRFQKANIICLLCK